MNGRTPRKSAFALFVVAFCAWSPKAQAASAIELVVPTPRECPSESELDARVRALAPGESFSGQRARARMARSGEGYRAELLLTLADGTTRERTVQAETCDTAMQALAVIFVASHAELALSEPESPPAASSPSPASPSPMSPSPVAPAPPAKPPQRATASAPWEVALAAEVVIDRGLLPKTALGGRLEVNAAKAWARGGMAVSALAPNEARSPFGATAEIHALLVDATFCGDADVLPFRLGACAGMSLVVLRGRGAEVDRPRNEDRFFPAAMISLDGRWPAHTRFGVRLSLAGRVPLARPEFSVLNDGPLHRPAAVCGDVVIGPEMRF